jgi:hypothetical protein
LQLTFGRFKLKNQKLKKKSLAQLKNQKLKKKLAAVLHG